MKFKTKLLLLVLLPVVISALTAIFISSAKLNKQGLETLQRKTEAILSRMEAVRSFVGTQNNLNEEVNILKEKYPDGNFPENEKQLLLRKVPIIASMEIGGMDAEKDAYTFRVASENARKKIYEATTKEKELIDMFRNDWSKNSHAFVNNETNELWVVRPVRLSKDQGYCTFIPS